MKVYTPTAAVIRAVTSPNLPIGSLSRLIRPRIYSIICHRSQESRFKIIYVQHAKECSLVLSNFSCFPHKLQQRGALPNCCFFVFKYTLQSVVAAIPNRSVQQTTSQTHTRFYYSSIVPFLFDYGFNFFQVISSRPDGINLNLERAIYFWLVIWVNLFL